MNAQVPNPGAGGSYLFDPETGETKLISAPTAPKENGTDSQKVPPSRDRNDGRNRPKSRRRNQRDSDQQS